MACRRFFARWAIAAINVQALGNIEGNGMKGYQILRVLLFMAMGIWLTAETKAQGRTEVLVVGTIHSGHDTNPNYSDQDILNILGTYGPDAICVEIPPFYFRRRSYLKEMMIASIYGLDNGKKVYPIDWWDTLHDARAERRRFVETDVYRVKSKLADSLEKSNRVMRAFVEKYGTLDSIWRSNAMGYEFFNGKDFNDYIREMYSISIAVFGDGCMNLYSELRNAKMMELINAAIAANREKRVVVLTGAEHKYYFDSILSKQGEVRLVSLEELLPLKTVTPTPNVVAFMESGLAKGYYDASDTASVDVLYQNALVPLIHGMGMDENPSLVPAKNLVKAESILAEWESQRGESVPLRFEEAWVKFLEKDYLGAIRISKSIAGRLGDLPKEKHWFFVAYYWRNLGFCYDMTHQRGKAINAYREGKKACRALGVSMDFAEKEIYKNFENEPYRGERNER